MNQIPPCLNWPEAWAKRLPPGRGKLSAVRLTDEGGGRRRRASRGFKTAPSSVTTFGRAPLPLLAFGHFPIPSVSLCSTSPLDKGSRPPDRGNRPSPHRGEVLGSVQIGRNLGLCGTFRYIYWELWIGAPIFFFQQIGQPKFALLWIFCENIHLFRIDIIRVKC